MRYNITSAAMHPNWCFNMSKFTRDMSKRSTADILCVNLTNPVGKQMKVGKGKLHDIVAFFMNCSFVMKFLEMCATLYASVMFNILMSMTGLSFLKTTKCVNHFRNSRNDETLTKKVILMVSNACSIVCNDTVAHLSVLVFSIA